MKWAARRLYEMILDELPVWQRNVVAERLRKVIAGFKVSL